jgi:hypothetical protein
MDFPIKVPARWLSSSKPKGKKPGESSSFGHSVMSYTKMDVPTVELYETAVTFEPGHTDPLSANAILARTFGSKAGVGFLFRRDTGNTPGRYWVYSPEPWREPPPEAVSALAPKRHVIQLVPGLPYRFAVEACLGVERVVDGEKEVEPFRTVQEVEAWLKWAAPQLGFRPDFFNVALREMRFPYGGRTVSLAYASIEGALHVSDPELMKAPLLRGLGSYRRVGLGLLQLSS